VNGIRKAANKETIADLGKTVAEYFKDQYEVELKYPNLQLLWVLMKFHDENKGRKLEKIVMYRDGVSEGHVLAVLAAELVAMREACQEPEITYIVVQKRHNTRFFPVDNNKYKNGNALAGTVVARWWIIFKYQKIPCWWSRPRGSAASPT
jgi:hypothetical protein